MSRAVSLRYQGKPIEARVRLAGGRVSLETEGRRLEASVSRDGPWIDLAIGARTARTAAARDGRGVWVSCDGRLYRFEVAHRHAEAGSGTDESGEVLAPMTGRVVAVEAREGAPVRDGDLLLTIEAMKMEFKVTAPASGTIAQVACAPGDRVELGQLLVRMEETVDAGEAP